MPRGRANGKGIPERAVEHMASNTLLKQVEIKFTGNKS